MTDTSYKDTSLFNRLKRLFSSDVIIRNQGRGELKVLDINKIQRSGKYQTNALIDRFSRLYVWNNRNVFNPTLNFQTLRIQLYSDYESMDTDAIISSVLDTVADECTLKNDRGEILNIVSSDENIKVALENLFYDVLNINFNLWAWIRSMLKYGDFFLKLEISEKFGVYNVLPYSVYHMSRVEGSDPNNPTKVVFHLDPDGQATSQDPNYVPKNSKSVIELQNYEVAHFRLLTDSNYLPYGRSYIEPARKIFKQLTLCLPGTATIWIPGGYKKLQDIKTGDPIYSFDYKANAFVENKVTGKIQTGIKPTYKIWTKHRCLEAAATHPVMVQGGTYKTVADLTINDCVVLGSNPELQDCGELPDFNLNVEKVKARLTEPGHRTESDVFVEKIIKIEKVSDGTEVFDISVESDLSNFVADGVVVHNCEDAALIHRIMRAPEKRIFYINVGQIPPNEVEQFMQKSINNIKKTPYVGPDGQYNLRFNMQNMMEDFYIPVRGGDTSTRIETTPGLNYDGINDVRYYQEKLFAALKVPKAFMGFEKDLCIVPETEIPLLDGTTKTVAQLIEDYENGIQNYTYSVDEKTLNIVPGKITWAGYTRKNAELVRVWLDNEQYLDTTPDHLFMTRDGEWVEAQNLQEGTSLMPLYTGTTKRGYTTVYQPGSQEYKEVHRLVPEYYGDIFRGSGNVVHHLDCNKHNNNPENLDCSMNFWEHRAYHAAHARDISRRLKEQGYYESEAYKERARQNGQKGGLKSAEKLGEWSRTHRPWNYIKTRDRSNSVCPICGKEFNPTYYGQSVSSRLDKTRCCSSLCAGQYKHLHPEEFNLKPTSTNKRKFIDLQEFFEVASTAKNFYEIMEHFNITRNTFNSFLKDHGIDKHELVWDVMLEAQKEPNFVRNFKKRRNHKVVKVEFLTERRDTCDLHIEDHHNFATAAGVFIHNSGKATLSAEDIKFARTVERIQKIIEAELTNIALVHLYALGFTGESLANFSINLTTPSIIFEQEKIALLKEKVDLASQMLDLKLFSSDYIYENIFGMSEDDYVQERDLVREDSKREFRLSQIESEGNDPAQSGRSYGTPHDLASMYGRRSTPAPKGASVSEVPAGYEELAKPVKNKHRTINTQYNPEGGRPRVRPSFYGTQNNPVGGADPTGRHNMHQPYKSDVEYVNETFVEPKQLVSFEDTKKSDNIYKGTLLDESIVDESTEKVERIINRRYDRLQGLSEKLDTEKEVL